MKWLGFIATTATFLTLFVAIAREPYRQEDALAEYHAQATAQAYDFHALNCEECHDPTFEIRPSPTNTADNPTSPEIQIRPTNTYTPSAAIPEFPINSTNTP